MPQQRTAAEPRSAPAEPAPPTPISVIIPAHNEATVVGRCLDALLTQSRPENLDVIVVANGCSDDTAAVARSRPGVRVIELPDASKAHALNAGDAAARGFPRLYLDADVVLLEGAVGRLAGALGSPNGPLAVVPRLQLATAGRPLTIRSFYAIKSRLPVYKQALFGRGAIALSAAGRRRFTAFPATMADDLFLDSQFSDTEKWELPAAVSQVETPRRLTDLIRVQARIRAGNAALRAGDASVRRADRMSWFTDVVLRKPWLAPAAMIYVTITVAAAVQARRAGTGHWARDTSSR